ncbi:RTA1 like protein-domain-containing protein [Aspergillus cavernicola]|uniref:RTA1 like protein-domain-containing protein n=1 Tax=Aspergillus cavernicola TaxID=176166 RepID=A0ABR4J1A5_9EURO
MHKRQDTTETIPDEDDWSVFFYDASLPAAIVFAALYIIPFCYHSYISYVAYRNGKYFRCSYSVPLLIAALVEIIGYGQRAASTQSVQDIGTFATSQTMIVLAPVLVCASLYILLSRIIRATQPHGPEEKEAKVLGGWLKVIWLPKIFITLDVGAMVTQGGGSSIAAAGEWKGQLDDIGTGVLIGGLALQLATFTMFLIVVVKFHRDAARSRAGAGALEEGMLKVIHGVYIAGFFIMIRSIFRLIEFAWGVDSYIMTNEWPIYVLEAVPMFIAFMVLGWYHPSRWLPASVAGESKAKEWLTRHRRRNLPQHQSLPSV